MARNVSLEAGKARAFAKAYVNLVEALLQQGVEEPTAREEARIAAMVHLAVLDEQQVPSKGSCPVCGR